MGPLLYVLYKANLANIVAAHGLDMHQYADDIQIYTSTAVDDAANTVDRSVRCIQDIEFWL